MNVFEPFLEKYYDVKYRKQGRSWGIEMTHVDLDVVPTSAPSLAEQGLLENMAVLSDNDVEEMSEMFAEIVESAYNPWKTAFAEFIVYSGQGGGFMGQNTSTGADSLDSRKKCELQRALCECCKMY